MSYGRPTMNYSELVFRKLQIYVRYVYSLAHPRILRIISSVGRPCTEPTSSQNLSHFKLIPVCITSCKARSSLKIQRSVTTCHSRKWFSMLYICNHRVISKGIAHLSSSRDISVSKRTRRNSRLLWNTFR